MFYGIKPGEWWDIPLDEVQILMRGVDEVRRHQALAQEKG